MLPVLSPLDWTFLAVLAGSLLLGAWRGLTYEVLSLLSWLAAFWLAQWFAPVVAQHLPLGGLGAPLSYAIGFLVVFIVVVFVGGLLSYLLSQVIATVGLRPIDRMLGALFGLLRGVLLLLLAVLVVGMTPWQSSAPWRASHGVHWAESALALIRPVLPHGFEKYLSSL